MDFLDNPMSEDELAFVLVNEPHNFNKMEATAIASALKDPDNDRIHKFAMLIRLGIAPKRAGALARELDTLIDNLAPVP